MLQKPSRRNFLFFPLLLFMFSHQFLFASPEIIPVQGVQYNVNFSFHANLKALTGKKVQLTLSSGQKLIGNIKSVGEHMLHLEKIQGREFFDALIRIENIIALETRFRQYKR